MSLSELHTKKDYFSPRDDIIHGFIIPALKESVRYDRATGFFSSYSLIDTSVGVCTLAKRNGRMRIITSPRLREEDVRAIKDGYDLRTTVEQAMIRDFEIPTNGEDIDRLSLLAYLIAKGILEIKVAVMNDLDQYPDAIFHAKIGIMYDQTGDVITFTGSANETRNGLGGNWDHISVTKSTEDYDKVKGLEQVFQELWDNVDPTTTVIDMPSAIKELIDHYYTESGVLELDEYFLHRFRRPRYFTHPPEIQIRDYQDNAVKKWIENGYRGLFNMCTGTGKTITALYSLEKLYENEGDGIATIILCPQRHLVDQWADNVRKFGVEPIVGYSNSPDKEWKRTLQRRIMIGNEEKLNFCLITTMNSFVSELIQELIKKISGDVALVVDEVHNMGSRIRLEALPDNIKYRLGLSATIERFMDVAGTQALRHYFGEECITYTLEQAIGTVLTNYRYHPIACIMDDDEYDSFVSINHEIERISHDFTLSDTNKKRLIKELRVKGIRLIAGIRSKYEILPEIVQNLENDTHTLVYCGKALWNGDEQDKSSLKECVRLVDKAVEILGYNGLGKTVSKFTYLETPEERRGIIREFTAGRTSTIIAISCLDEGVDIPSIKTAIITSSSENPKEYIQRRGRVLRKFPGKEYADIYDLIAIPKPIEYDNSRNPGADVEKKLLAREMARMKEFSRLSINQDETIKLVEQIGESYNIDPEHITDNYSWDYDE